MTVIWLDAFRRGDQQSVNRASEPVEPVCNFLQGSTTKGIAMDVWDAYQAFRSSPRTRVGRRMPFTEFVERLEAAGHSIIVVGNCLHVPGLRLLRD